MSRSEFTVVVQGRWAEFSVFEDTRLEFDQRTFLNRPAANDVRDRFRLGAGIQYLLLPGVYFRIGFSWEKWAIKANSLSPTLPDLTEYYLPAVGLSVERGSWRFSFLGGYAYVEGRRVKANQNPFFPGHYTLDQAIFGLQVTRLFGSEPVADAMKENVVRGKRSRKLNRTTEVRTLPHSQLLLAPFGLSIAQLFIFNMHSRDPQTPTRLIKKSLHGDFLATEVFFSQDWAQRFTVNDLYCGSVFLHICKNHKLTSCLTGRMKFINLQIHNVLRINP